MTLHKNGGASTTFCLLCAVAAVVGMDLQLLPACFRAMERELGLSPSSLSLLVAIQGVSISIASPIWGSIADSGYSRKRLMMLGTAVWGCLTTVLASVNDLHTMLALRVFNGAALGMLAPMVQTLVAEESARNEIGYSFGWVEFSSNLLGQAPAMLIVTGISNKVYFGISGWRLAYRFVGVASIALCMLIGALMPDKCSTGTNKGVDPARQLQRFWDYMCIPTFQVIVAQGVVGSIPWAAWSFSTMFFQYIGFADVLAGMLSAAFVVGVSLGNLLGGAIGDRLEALMPKHGRATTAQISVTSGILLCVIVFQMLPRDHPPFLPTAMLLFAFGLMASWCKSGCNAPIFLEIVSEEHRASAFSLFYGLEGAIAQFAGPVGCAFLSETMFGYTLTKTEALDISRQSTNAGALANSLTVCMISPWLLCLCIYTCLHYTHKKDALYDASGKAIPNEKTALKPATDPGLGKLLHHQLDNQA